MNNNITVTVSTDKSQYSLDEKILLNFKISNDTEKRIKVCKILTPCEGFMGDFFNIKNNTKDKSLKYMGPMVKREKPTGEDFIEIGPNDFIICTINLREAYIFKDPGIYSIQFKGKRVNKLPDSNNITLELHND